MDEAYRFVKPLKGLIVRDSTSKAIIPETGTTVPWIGPEGRYWRRRLKDGSITIEEQPITEVKEEVKPVYKKYTKE